METETALACLAALSQQTRLDAFRQLVAAEPKGLPAGEIARKLGVPQNTLSAHLNVLSHANLVRSARNGRSVVYRADLARLNALIRFLVEDCCGGAGCAGAELLSLSKCEERKMTTDKTFNVLFLCTGNSARSIMAESILRQIGAGRFNVFSAGSHPKGEVHPYALLTLEKMGFPYEGFRSKSWDEFAAPGAPQMDFVFTVCDNAAGEACPLWPGQPMTANWGIEDPAAEEGSDIDKQRAFALAFRYMKNRIQQFCAIPLHRLDKLAVGKRLREIGDMEGATHPHTETD
jgi:arsenate reductase